MSKKKVILRERSQVDENCREVFRVTDLLHNNFRKLQRALFKNKIDGYSIFGYHDDIDLSFGYIVFDRTKLKHILLSNTISFSPVEIDPKGRPVGAALCVTDSLMIMVDLFFENVVKERYKECICFCLQDKYVIKCTFNDKKRESSKWTTEEIYNCMLQIVEDLNGHLAEIDKKIEELARDILLQLGVKKEDL